MRVEQDESEAFAWYRKASEAGDAEAALKLADLYRNGIGGERDRERAFEIYRQYAEAGNGSAMFRLMLCYLTGRGCERDFEAVVFWRRKWKEERGYAGVTDGVIEKIIQATRK